METEVLPRTPPTDSSPGFPPGSYTTTWCSAKAGLTSAQWQTMQGCWNLRSSQELHGAFRWKMRKPTQKNQFPRVSLGSISKQKSEHTDQMGRDIRSRKYLPQFSRDQKHYQYYTLVGPRSVNEEERRKWTLGLRICPVSLNPVEIFLHIVLFTHIHRLWHLAPGRSDCGTLGQHGWGGRYCRGGRRVGGEKEEFLPSSLGSDPFGRWWSKSIFPNRAFFVCQLPGAILPYNHSEAS